jgi:CRISPR-associated protein Cas1
MLQWGRDLSVAERSTFPSARFSKIRCASCEHRATRGTHAALPHQPRFGRPALALDLMEGFRPLIADSAVLSAVNTRMVTAADFIQVGNAVALTPAGRKGFIHAYEQRIDTLATHPLFGYRVTYRRILEIQARLLARFVTGELARYPGFETR